MAFFVFLIYNNVYFEYTQCSKKVKLNNSKTVYSKPITDELDSLKNTYYSMKRNLLFFASKLKEKIHDASNAKEYYELFLKKKNRKLVKQSKIFTQRKPKHY